MPDHLLGRDRVRVHVVEIARQVPAHEAGTEQVTGARHLVGRWRHPQLHSAEKGIAPGVLLNADQPGPHRWNLQPAVAVKRDRLTARIVEQDLVFGAVVRIAVTFDPGETGRGQQNVSGKLLRRVANHKGSGDIQPAGFARCSVRKSGGRRIQGSGILRFGGSSEEGAGQAGKEHSPVDGDHGGPWMTMRRPSKSAGAVDRLTAG